MEDIEERVVGGLTVRIDRDMCIGSQNCVNLAIEVFEMGSDQVVTVRDDAEEIMRQRLVEACRVCPVDALHLYEEDGTQIVPM